MMRKIDKIVDLAKQMVQLAEPATESSWHPFSLVSWEKDEPAILFRNVKIGGKTGTRVFDIL